ncbi:TonB-dependent receptor [Sphingomonas oligophenolica]|uniref:TonB-dependent receptor n=1 Tax=Sphingomonas oligophenolica TaxID=301154 RepID=A0ABU9XYI3_9SPHN
MHVFVHSRLTAGLLASASASALVFATPALAQAAPASTQTAPAATPDDQSTTQDIVVTAQFRREKLQDTPIAITAVNAAQMEAKNQTDLAQVADSAPNVSLKPQGASFGPSITASIRGVGQNDFNPAYEPGVGIYIDDVYYPQLTGAVFDLLDLDRVEILRGPQGTLAGRNSEGGSIKIYSKMPHGDNGGFVEATYGSRNRIGLRAAADFKLTDTLFARISGVFKQQDGFVDRIDYGCAHPGSGVATSRSAGDCRISKLGGVGYQAIRGILRWEPTDALSVTVIGDYTHDEHTIAGEVLLTTSTINSPNVNAAPGVPYDNRFVCGKFCNYITTGQPAGVWVPPIPVDPYHAAGTPLAATSGTDRSLYDGWGFSGQINYQLNDAISLTSISGYRAFDTRFDSDDDLSPASNGFGLNHLTNWSFSQEVRANVELARTLNFTLGGYYFKQHSLYDSTQDIRYVPVYPLQFRQPDPTDAEAKAVFAHLSWKPVDNLTLSGGLRYTDESKSQTYYRFNYDGTINRFVDPIGAAYGAGYVGLDTLNVKGDPTATVKALTGLTAKYKASRVDYRLAADYRFSPALLVYASFSTGFKGGGSNPRPFNANQVIAFAPEQLNAYEIGLKSDLFDRKLRFNLSGFINKYKDIQIPVSTCPDAPCAARLNAGKGTIKGFEAELTAFPVPGLSIDASLSYLSFNYDAASLNPAASYPTNPGGVTANDPTTVPPWKASGGIQYKIPLGSAGSLTPRFDVNYQGKQYTGPTVINNVRYLNFIPSYTLANARLTWTNEGGDLDVSVEAQNLFDKYYLLTIFDLRGAGAGFRKGRPGSPQEFAVTVKKKF